MDLSDLIEQDAIFPSLRSQTKKQVLQDLSERAAALAGLSPRDVYETVAARERLGSTGIGGGIAIPHGKIAGLSRIRGVFGRLAKPVDFDSLDDQPVDLVFLLLAPEDSGADHLKALSKIARLLRDPSVLGQLRALHDATTIHNLMTHTVPPFAA
ncbi:PTS IIA-like nitrogen regulatory protein PtsN [Aureimonas jatrophae]|uniref:PTS IIA-like nitrogen-regulatory protein PtsN n=1 Tax=Aureimonas jatrophae TaxID=1166073 RepID=A0A1H0IMQ5_9HYPH|nr:PTS IIA-like nitrogen regulatory protein PtsN [Aureimonas jatrophae]MBB3952259.1 PTS system nitrogen regulatory IIA component [Aureimonas jatrophae]SDO32683.1 PTS IIA-like nitrogen-regulatory protein PtsN [Aureimonas jatrophae]